MLLGLCGNYKQLSISKMALTTRIITPAEQLAYDAIVFARQIGAFRDYCRKYRRTTSYDTIRNSFADFQLDSPVHRRIRELAVLYWAAQSQPAEQQEQTRELQAA